MKFDVEKSDLLVEKYIFILKKPEIMPFYIV